MRFSLLIAGAWRFLRTRLLRKISEVEVDLLAQPSFRADAEAVADDQHPDHQLGIDRRPPEMAVEARQFAPDLVQLDKPVYRAQQMIGWNVLLQRELIEQRSLLDLPMSHHERQPCRSTGLNHSSSCVATADFFNTIGPKRTRTLLEVCYPSPSSDSASEGSDNELSPKRLRDSRRPVADQSRMALKSFDLTSSTNTVAGFNVLPRPWCEFTSVGIGKSR